MKVAVDGYEIGLRSTGVGRVTHNLLMNLFELMPEHRFFVFTREVAAMFSKSNMTQVNLPSRGGYFRWQNGPFARGLRKLRPDLLIAPNYALPLSWTGRSLLFEHDLSMLARPNWYPRRTALVRGILVRRSLKKASRVVVPSEFTRMEVMRLAGLPPEKLTLLGYGVESRFRKSSSESIERWKGEMGLKGKKVVAFLGSIFNRRNVPALVAGLDLLRKRHPDVVLHLVGKDLTHPPQPISKILAREWVRWDQALPEDDLPLFYSAADVFAYLSEYEGFGFPPLEALACGSIPVLLKTSSLREVFEGLAVMVEKPAAEEIAAGLESALEEGSLKTGILDKFSRKREDFSWLKSASELSGIIRELLCGGAALP